MLVEKKLLAGRYEFCGELGNGGESSVYRGFDKRLGIEVAVKQYNSEREFCDNSPVNDCPLLHPAFPRVTDIICEEGFQYVIMDYVDGQDGAEFVQNNGVLRGGQLREAAVKLCNAMRYLHNEKKVLHCDLKPQNMIFCKNGEIKLVDVACLDLSNTTELTMSEEKKFGTPGFAAPEVCNFGRYSNCADVFSYGATLYFLATGRTPSIENFVLPSCYNKELGTKIESLIVKCMKPIPSDRFKSFEAIIAELNSENQISKGFRNKTINFLNNAEMAFEYAYVLSEKLNKKVLIGITNKAYELLDERMIYFDTHSTVLFIRAIEAMGENVIFDVKDFAVQVTGLSGVYATVIPEEKETKDLARKFLEESAKQFDCLIFISVMDYSLFADANILSIPENTFEAQALIESLKQLKIKTENFRYVVFDGILNTEEAKKLFSEEIKDKIATAVQNSPERNESRAYGCSNFSQIEHETEISYIRLAQELGLTNSTDLRFKEENTGEQYANGNKPGRHRRNEEGASLWKQKLGSNKNGGRYKN